MLNPNASSCSTSRSERAEAQLSPTSKLQAVAASRLLHLLPVCYRRTGHREAKYGDQNLFKRASPSGFFVFFFFACSTLKYATPKKNVDHSCAVTGFIAKKKKKMLKARQRRLKSRLVRTTCRIWRLQRGLSVVWERRSSDLWRFQPIYGHAKRHAAAERASAFVYEPRKTAWQVEWQANLSRLQSSFAKVVHGSQTYLIKPRRG